MSTAVRRGIYGKLAGDSTLNDLLATPPDGYVKSIYHQIAPQKPTPAPYPFVIINKQAGTPTEAFGKPSALDTDVWEVKAVTRDTTADTAEAIQSRIIVLLNDAALSISGLTLLYLRRQSDIEYSQEVGGVLYQHAGALFRLVVT